MSTISWIQDERAADSLAGVLNGSDRVRPIVVATVPAGGASPWIDVEEIATQTGRLADIYVIPTGAVSWQLSRRMPEGTQVYGGAGRVYPVGHEWVSDLSRSPLRFAFDAEGGSLATQQLISDALRMAAAAGLLQARPSRVAEPVDGVVKWATAGRAAVELSNGTLATIAEELTAENVAIERLVGVGQRVEGLFDPDSRRLDVTAHLRPAAEALAGYAVGDVVLTRVLKVRNGKAELLLYPTTPEVRVAVLRAEVTSNPADDLRTLMTVGEVIPARVTATAPHWALALHDVDDDEAIVPAPSLLPGGPPWLVEEAGTSAEGSAEVPLPMPAERAAPAPATAATPAPATPPSVPPVAAPRPSMFDRNRPRPSSPTPSSPTPSEWTPQTPATPAAEPPQPSATKTLLRKIDALNAEVARLGREETGLRIEIAARNDERSQLRYLLDQAQREAGQAKGELKSAKARLRKVSTKSTPPPEIPQFADPEQGFRHLVVTRWATRTPLGEQAARPLPEYFIGPRFIGSLQSVEGISVEKVADVVVEIATGLAPQLASREVHRLRSGAGGEDPVRIRQDGAVAWRASLQINSPSARRIHYWILPDGRFEFARVTTHDSFEI